MAAEIANYGGGGLIPTNSSDQVVDWNWTHHIRTNESVDTPYYESALLSTGFHASIIAVLAFLIAAGMLLNLVTVVTHFQT